MSRHARNEEPVDPNPRPRKKIPPREDRMDITPIIHALHEYETTVRERRLKDVIHVAIQTRHSPIFDANPFNYLIRPLVGQFKLKMTLLVKVAPDLMGNPLGAELCLNIVFPDDPTRSLCFRVAVYETRVDGRVDILRTVHGHPHRNICNLWYLDHEEDYSRNILAHLTPGQWPWQFAGIEAVAKQVMEKEVRRWIRHRFMSGLHDFAPIESIEEYLAEMTD